MLSLDEVLTRLDQQFIDPHQLVLSMEGKTEAVRQALQRVNAYLGAEYELAGLDSAVETTLPAACEAALVSGTAAGVLAFVMQHNLGSLSSIPGDTAASQTWIAHLERQFESQLERQRQFILQSGAGSPYATWESSGH